MIEISTESICITPPKEYMPCYMSGNPLREEKTDKVHDDLFCTVLILKINQEDVLIWGSFDLINLDKDLATGMREALLKEYQVPLDHIILGATHTHYAPEVGNVNVFGLEYSVVVPGYREYLSAQCMTAVKRCYEKGFTEVSPFVQTLTIDGLYGNRNDKEKLSDKGVFILKFRDTSGNLVGSCVNLSCHPTIGDPLNLELSGDLFGYLAEQLLKEWKIRPLMMQGSPGDMSNRQYRKGANFDEVRRIGDGILSQIKEKAGSEIPITIDKCVIDSYQYFNEYTRSEEEQRKMEDDILLDEKKLEQETNFDQQKLLKSGLAFMQLKVREKTVINTFEASIIRLGDLEICQIPAELFSQLGLRIKSAGTEKYTIIWGYTNDSIGYLVQDEDYDSCYEGRSTDFGRGEPEKIVDALVTILKKK